MDDDIVAIANANGGYWGAHPEHTLADWQESVSHDDTRLGYWEWVEARIADAEI